MNGLWSFAAAVATLAGMATFIGVVNRWPAHETIGSLIVCVVSGLLATILAKRADDNGRGGQ